LFINLHSHTNSSIGDGFSHADEHFAFALENGMNAMAITDHGNMSELGYIYQAKNSFKKKGIAFKPIIGVEAYYIPSIHRWREQKARIEEAREEDSDLVVEVEKESKGKSDPIRRRHHLILLATNRVGYSNLCQLVTRSYREGFYRFPRIDIDMLEQHNEGIVMSSACLAGQASFLVLQNHELGEEAVFRALDSEFLPLLQLFGKERSNLEIQFNRLPEQRIVNDYLIKYAKKTGYPLLATADSHYPRPELWRQREMYRLLAQQTKGFNVSIEDLPKSKSELKCELYPKNFDQMIDSYMEMYPDADEELDSIVVEALKKSSVIAFEQCEEIGQDSTMKLPKAFLKGKDPDEKLWDLCEEAFRSLPEEKQTREYFDRLEYEFSVIKKKGFSLYFLALREALEEIRKEMIIGAGRGSGAGSLICYLLKITLIDPVENGLIFERFMSENRAEPPDIDCLHEATLVLTPAGPRRIGDLRVGDEVIDINNERQQVLATQKRNRKEGELVYKIVVATNTDENYEVLGNIFASGYHKFFLQDRSIVLCKDLKEGDKLSPGSEVVRVTAEEKDVVFIENTRSSAMDVVFVDITVSNSSSFRIYPFDFFETADSKMSHSAYGCFLDVHNCDVSDRDHALDIIRDHFGQDNVIAISNYNTLQLKSLTKDVSKFYNIPFEEVNAVTSIMESEARQPILDSIGNDQKLYVFDYDGAYKYSPTFKAFADKYPDLRASLSALFKQTKSISRHAGGCVITENPDQSMPIIRIRGVDQTPWGEGLAAKHLEPMGFIKYDFLGIATLRVIESCIRKILKNTIGADPTFDEVKKFFEENLSPDVIREGDKEVFESIYHNGKFCGTFQFTQGNAQSFCKESRPQSVSDISTITAIYRPGPLASGTDKKYVDLVNGNNDPDFYHRVIKEVLGETYGLLIFQEQIMFLANKLGGFSLTESDELRKLLSKPVVSLGEEMKKKRVDYGEKFIAGCVNNGISEERATRLWFEEILPHCSYSFNKSHSVSYAYLSYQCSWLFHFYPNEWVCAYLENDSDKEAAMAEVEQNGYVVGSMDILNSGIEYSVKGNVVYPSLSSIKGIGDSAVNELLELREGWTPGEDGLANFCSFFYNTESTLLKNGKTKTKRVWRFTKFSKKALYALISLEAVGRLTIFPAPFLNHKHLLNFLEANWDKKENQSFDILQAIESADSEDFTSLEIIDAQDKYLGSYDKNLIVSAEQIQYMKDYGVISMSELTTYPQKIWFILKDIEAKKTKKEKTYYKLTIMDIDGTSKTFNYFYGEPREGWVKRGVYVGHLFENQSFINNERGTFLERIA
jgi:DNA polymerase III alpha subunit